MSQKPIVQASRNDQHAADGGVTTGPVGWVLYDDSCGFCRRWIPFWEGVLRKQGLAIAPLQAAWVVKRLDASEADLLADLRLLLADGTQVRGADVYRYAMRRIWWARPLYLLSRAPVLRRIFDWGYRTFADNRYRFSRACGLPGKAGTIETRVGVAPNIGQVLDAQKTRASDG